MADFNKAYIITMGHEGGIANDPDDAGGLTYKGITIRDWPNWPGWTFVIAARKQYGNDDIADRVLAKNEGLQGMVRAFYKVQYWDVNRLDEFVSQEIANELFDSGVNCGWQTAALWLQKSLNLLNNVQNLYPNIDEDGRIGPTTLTLTNKHPYPKVLLKMLNLLQGRHYIGIMERKESQEKFARSWLSRVVLS